VAHLRQRRRSATRSKEARGILAAVGLSISTSDDRARHGVAKFTRATGCFRQRSAIAPREKRSYRKWIALLDDAHSGATSSVNVR
jgi:hypothetical protein